MNACWIIVNKDFIIESLSAGCIGQLNLSKNIIRKKIKFSDMAPDVLNENKRKNFYFGIRGGPIVFKMPTFKNSEENEKKGSKKAGKNKNEEGKGFHVSGDQKNF